MLKAPHTSWLLAAAILCLTPTAALADEGDTLTVDERDAAAEALPAAEAPPDDDPQAPTGEAEARDVMDQLLQQRRNAPTIEPTRDPAVNPEPSRVGVPAATIDLDPAIVGIAPAPVSQAPGGLASGIATSGGVTSGGGEKPQLLPEGTFIVNRRGRILRSPDGAHVIFAFEADDAESPEAPMILQPCRKLQDMEDYVEKHGDHTTFRVSGQVHTYRGANYLMPTMMVIDIDRGNLDP